MVLLCTRRESFAASHVAMVGVGKGERVVCLIFRHESESPTTMIGSVNTTKRGC